MARQAPSKAKTKKTPPKAPTRQKTSATTAAVVLPYGDALPVPDPSQIPAERALTRYGGASWVYISVNRIANACAQINLNIIKADKRNQPEAENTGPAGGLRALLQKPNPYQSRYDFIERGMMMLELSGDLYIELAEKVGKRPTEMYVLDSSKMEIIPDKKKFINRYEYTVNGVTIPFAPEDIIHIKYANPLNEFYGLSPLQAAMLALEIDKGAIDWNRNFLKKGAWPSGALKTANEVGKEGLKRLRAEMKSLVHRGKDQAGQLLLLTGGLEFQKIALTPKEMDWLDARRMSRDEILAIYGVPFAVAGLYSTEQTTARSAGVNQQVKNFYMFTVFPKVDKLVAALNRQLTPLFPGSHEIIPDIRGVMAMQEDVQKQLVLSQTFRTLVAAGWPPNAALAELYPHVKRFPHGDVAWLQQAMIPVDGPENDYVPTVEEQAEAAAENVETDPADSDGGEPPPGKAAAKMLGINSGADDALGRIFGRHSADL